MGRGLVAGLEGRDRRAVCGWFGGCGRGKQHCRMLGNGWGGGSCERENGCGIWAKGSWPGVDSFLTMAPGERLLLLPLYF